MSDANIEEAVAIAAEGSFRNSGQRCSAVKRIFVHSDIYTLFCDHLVQKTKTYSCGDPMNSSTDVGTVISEEDAIYIATNYMKEGLEISNVETIYDTGKQHEYREKLLPAYVINYKSDENLKAYISIKNAKFQTVRHRDWRWFDFLWMTHTMDYEGRDDFNNTVLRIFSLLGLITVMSGFSLWFVSSPTVRKFLN